MRRLAVAAAAVLLVAGCGGSTHRVFSTGVVGLGRPVRPLPPSPTSLRYSAASNRAAAIANVRKLVGVVVVPLGARRVARVPSGAPAWFRDDARAFRPSFRIATTQRLWIVRRPLKQTVLFIQSHVRSRPRPEARYRAAPNRIGSRPSRSYEFPPIPGRSWARWLNVNMAPLPGGRTVVFVRAGDQWIVPPPRSAIVPGTVRRIDIVSRYGKSPSVLVHVRKRYDVASIVALTNGLGAAPSRIVCAYATFGGPTVTLRYRAADGHVLARAQVSGLLSGPCNPLQLTVGKHRVVALLGADLLERIQRVLNIDLAPPSPLTVGSCLRREGWSFEQTIDRSPAELRATKNGRTWTVTFRLTGKLTTDRPAPSALRRCLRSAPRIVVYG